MGGTMSLAEDMDAARGRAIAVEAFEIWNRAGNTDDRAGRPASLQAAASAAANSFRPGADDDRWLHATLALLFGFPLGARVRGGCEGGATEDGIIADPPTRASKQPRHMGEYLWVRYDNSPAEWTHIFDLQAIADEPTITANAMGQGAETP